jgi:hypothetical protein
MKANMKYFTGSFWFTVIAMVLGYVYGMYTTGSVAASMSMVAVIGILSVLEVSLSFDNAIVNAKILKDMDEVWRKRFVTWGMVIAVLGMRLIFPVVIVSLAGSMGMWEAFSLGFSNPTEYSRILNESHTSVAGFGGAFLLLVSLGFFFDYEKDVHWVKHVEYYLSKIGAVKSSEVLVTLSALVGITYMLPETEQMAFLIAGIAGVITHEVVKGLGDLMEAGEEATISVAKAGLMSLLYLEVLDASFSFDGVVASFVITKDIIIIALGLGVGAMFVRSLTLFFVAKDTLGEFKYLEHGAFWAILSLAVIMFMSTMCHIPELVSGSIAVVLIGASLISSVLHKEE